MSEKFAKFLESHFGQFDESIANIFKGGLAKSTGSMEGLERMTATLFSTALQNVESE
jgi:hypothetical protein